MVDQVTLETNPLGMSAAAPSDVPQVRFSNISLEYLAGNRVSRVKALDRVSFDVKQGEFVSIVGPSGCGKSTLLSIVAGLLRPSGGEAYYLGEPIRGTNRNIGFITQQDNLLPWQTVEKNIELALRISRESKEKRQEIVQQWISIVGLEGTAKMYPRELSGGMRQRVAIARTLCYSPQTVLLDEPFGALDAQLKMQMQQQLLELWQRVRCTMLFVTHDLGEAALLSDRIVVMSPKPGRVAEIRDIAIPRPRSVRETRFTKEFQELEHDLWEALERHGGITDPVIQQQNQQPGQQTAQ